MNEWESKVLYQNFTVLSTKNTNKGLSHFSVKTAKTALATASKFETTHLYSEEEGYLLDINFWSKICYFSNKMHEHYHTAL